MDNDLTKAISIEKFTKFVGLGNLSGVLIDFNRVGDLFFTLGAAKPRNAYAIKLSNEYFHGLTLKREEKKVEPINIDPKLKAKVRKSILDFAKSKGATEHTELSISEFKKKYGYSKDIDNILIDLNNDNVISFRFKRPGSEAWKNPEEWTNGVKQKFGTNFHFVVNIKI